LSNGTLTITGDVVNNGSIIVDPSTMTLAARTGTGEVVIESGSTVVTQGTVAAGETIAFAGGNGDLSVAFASFSGTIDGFDATDTIDLPGVTDATSAGIVNGNTLQIQRSGNPAISFALHPDQSYMGGLFAVGANGALTSDLGRTLTWIDGGGNTAFDTTANWDDIPDSLDPAQAAPNATDTVEFNSSVGGISGTGTVAAVEVGSNGDGVLQLSVGATLATESLDAGVVATDVGQIGLTGAGTELMVTGSATVADDGTGVLSVLAGATFAATGLTIGAQGDSSGALVASGEGSAVQLSGALNIGTALGIGDLTVGPGAAVHASVVNLQGQVVLEGGLLDPTVQLINQGQTAGGFGTIAAGDIVDEGVIQAGGNKASQKLLLIVGTVLGGGTLTVNGTQPGSNPVGVLQINAGGTMELTGPVINAATTTFTDNLTPTGTYTVNNSVVDVTFADAAGVLKLDDIAGFAGTITTHQAGDSFVITGGTLSGLNVSNGNTLTMSDAGPGAGAGGIDSIIFNAAVDASGFNIVNGNTVQVACFAEGTRIETVNGLVAVEALLVGDRVVTAEDGSGEPVIWIGRRAVNCSRHPNPETVWPVRVRAGAFGPGRPARDLYLSPDHAVFVNDVLVPVKLLINGISIAQVKRDRVTYFHVELPRHAMILAEGLSVESYLETGDRADVDHDRAMRLHPDFGRRLRPEMAMLWELKGAAPLVMTGPYLGAARQLIAGIASRGDVRFWRPVSRPG
jgi:collagen type I alpha